MSESVNTPDLGGIISQLLSNPSALSGMMNLITNMRIPPKEAPQNTPIEAESTESDQKIEDKAIPVAAEVPNVNLAALAPLLSGVGIPSPIKAEGKSEKEHGTFDPMKRRRCLLEAIRPYLSPARCEHLNLLLSILDILSLLSSKK